MRQKATKVRKASRTSWDWLNLPEKSRPAKTKRFLIHSCGRPVLIAARSGERRGTTGSLKSGASSAGGTVGCSEVIVSTLCAPVASEAHDKGERGRERVAPCGGDYGSMR